MGKEIPCTLMRGGTSKGLFFMESDLPVDEAERNALISRAYGSPDPNGRQIDGLGGATSTTSKTAIISNRHGELNTVNYTFGQVDITSPLIDMKGNCGNISSAVGPFAIDKGLIEQVEEPITKVRIYNTNTQKYIVAHVPTKDGKTLYEGDFEITGIPFTGSKIQLDFMEPGGSVTGELLPTGRGREFLKTDTFGEFEVSIVDAANPCVFIRAKDIGMTGAELPKDVDMNADLLGVINEIRGAAAVRIGLADSIQEAIVKSPAVPKMCFVAEPTSYVSNSGAMVEKEQIDVLARMMSMGKLHPNYAITGGVCLAVASKIDGTLVAEMCKGNGEAVRIGHCGGVMEVGAEVILTTEGKWHAVRGIAFRTARRLMEGTLYL